MVYRFREQRQRRWAFARANAMVKLEGWEPSARILALQEDVIAGRRTVAEVEALLIEAARQRDRYTPRNC